MSDQNSESMMLELRSEVIRTIALRGERRRGDADIIEVGSESAIDQVGGTEELTVEGKLQEEVGDDRIEQATDKVMVVNGPLTIDVHSDTTLMAGKMDEVFIGATLLLAGMSDDLAIGGGCRFTGIIDLWVAGLLGMEEKIGSATTDGIQIDLGPLFIDREYGPGLHNFGMAIYNGALYQTQAAGFRQLYRVWKGVRNTTPGGGGGGGGGNGEPPSSGLADGVSAGSMLSSGVRPRSGTSVDEMQDLIRASEETATTTEDLANVEDAATAGSRPSLRQLLDQAQAAEDAQDVDEDLLTSVSRALGEGYGIDLTPPQSATGDAAEDAGDAASAFDNPNWIEFTMDTETGGTQATIDTQVDVPQIDDILQDDMDEVFGDLTRRLQQATTDGDASIADMNHAADTAQLPGGRHWTAVTELEDTKKELSRVMASLLEPHAADAGLSSEELRKLGDSQDGHIEARKYYLLAMRRAEAAGDADKASEMRATLDAYDAMAQRRMVATISEADRLRDMESARLADNIDQDALAGDLVDTYINWITPPDSGSAFNEAGRGRSNANVVTQDQYLSAQIFGVAQQKVEQGYDPMPFVLEKRSRMIAGGADPEWIDQATQQTLEVLARHDTSMPLSAPEDASDARLNMLWQRNQAILSGDFSSATEWQRQLDLFDLDPAGYEATSDLRETFRVAMESPTPSSSLPVGPEPYRLGDMESARLGAEVDEDALAMDILQKKATSSANINPDALGEELLGIETELTRPNSPAAFTEGPSVLHTTTGTGPTQDQLFAGQIFDVAGQQVQQGYDPMPAVLDKRSQLIADGADPELLDQATQQTLETLAKHDTSIPMSAPEDASDIRSDLMWQRNQAIMSGDFDSAADLQRQLDLFDLDPDGYQAAKSAGDPPPPPTTPGSGMPPDNAVRRDEFDEQFTKLLSRREEADNAQQKHAWRTGASPGGLHESAHQETVKTQQALDKMMLDVMSPYLADLGATSEDLEKLQTPSRARSAGQVEEPQRLRQWFRYMIDQAENSGEVAKAEEMRQALAEYDAVATQMIADSIARADFLSAFDGYPLSPGLDIDSAKAELNQQAYEMFDETTRLSREGASPAEIDAQGAAANLLLRAGQIMDMGLDPMPQLLEIARAEIEKAGDVARGPYEDALRRVRDVMFEMDPSITQQPQSFDLVNDLDSMRWWQRQLFYAEDWEGAIEMQRRINDLLSRGDGGAGAALPPAPAWRPPGVPAPVRVDAPDNFVPVELPYLDAAPRAEANAAAAGDNVQMMDAPPPGLEAAANGFQFADGAADAGDEAASALRLDAAADADQAPRLLPDGFGDTASNTDTLRIGEVESPAPGTLDYDRPPPDLPDYESIPGQNESPPAYEVGGWVGPVNMVEDPPNPRLDDSGAAWRSTADVEVVDRTADARLQNSNWIDNGSYRLEHEIDRIPEDFDTTEIRNQLNDRVSDIQARLDLIDEMGLDSREERTTVMLQNLGNQTAVRLEELEALNANGAGAGAGAGNGQAAARPADDIVDLAGEDADIRGLREFREELSRMQWTVPEETDPDQRRIQLWAEIDALEVLKEAGRNGEDPQASLMEMYNLSRAEYGPDDIRTRTWEGAIDYQKNMANLVDQVNWENDIYIQLVSALSNGRDPRSELESMMRLSEGNPQQQRYLRDAMDWVEANLNLPDAVPPAAAGGADGGGDAGFRYMDNIDSVEHDEFDQKWAAMNERQNQTKKDLHHANPQPPEEGGPARDPVRPGGLHAAAGMHLQDTQSQLDELMRQLLLTTGMTEEEIIKVQKSPDGLSSRQYYRAAILDIEKTDPARAAEMRATLANFDALAEREMTEALAYADWLQNFPGVPLSPTTDAEGLSAALWAHIEELMAPLTDFSNGIPDVEDPEWHVHRAEAISIAKAKVDAGLDPVSGMLEFIDQQLSMGRPADRYHGLQYELLAVMARFDPNFRRFPTRSNARAHKVWQRNELLYLGDLDSALDVQRQIEAMDNARQLRGRGVSQADQVLDLSSNEVVNLLEEAGASNEQRLVEPLAADEWEAIVSALPPETDAVASAQSETLDGGASSRRVSFSEDSLAEGAAAHFLGDSADTGSAALPIDDAIEPTIPLATATDEVTKKAMASPVELVLPQAHGEDVAALINADPADLNTYQPQVNRSFESWLEETDRIQGAGASADSVENLV